MHTRWFISSNSTWCMWTDECIFLCKYLAWPHDWLHPLQLLIASRTILACTVQARLSVPSDWEFTNRESSWQYSTWRNSLTLHNTRRRVVSSQRDGEHVWWQAATSLYMVCYCDFDADHTMVRTVYIPCCGKCSTNQTICACPVQICDCPKSSKFVHIMYGRAWTCSHSWCSTVRSCNKTQAHTNRDDVHTRITEKGMNNMEGRAQSQLLKGFTCGEAKVMNHS